MAPTALKCGPILTRDGDRDCNLHRPEHIELVLLDLAASDRQVSGNEILDTQTAAWGIKVANVEIKHIDIEDGMVRAIARQAEAERERSTKFINAEGVQQAARKLLEGAEILSTRPDAAALHCRRKELAH